MTIRTSSRWSLISVILAFSGVFWPCEVRSAEEESGVKTQDAHDEQDARPLPDLPLAITSFGAERIGDALYVYGGHHGEAHHYSTAGQSGDLLRLDLKRPDKWKVIAAGPKLQGLALVAHDGTLYRIGGFQARNAEGEDHDLWSLADFARFDPQNEKWESLPDMPSPRSSFDAVVVEDCIYVIGGWSMQGGKETQWRDDAYAFDLQGSGLKAQGSGKWRAIAKPPFQRRAMCTGARGGKIYVIGGMQPDGKITTAAAVYDPETDSWSDGPKLPGEPMEGFGAACCAVDDELYVSTSGGSLLKLSEDGQKWQSAGKLETGRFFHQMLPLGENRVGVIAGAHMEVGRFKDVQALNLGN